MILAEQGSTVTYISLMSAVPKKNEKDSLEAKMYVMLVWLHALKEKCWIKMGESQHNHSGYIRGIRKALTHCCFNVGTTSQTVEQD